MSEPDADPTATPHITTRADIEYVDGLRAEIATHAHKEQLFKQIVDDLFDGMECEPTCDKVAHEETCPAIFGPEAVKRLRARIRGLEAETHGDAYEGLVRWRAAAERLQAALECGRPGHTYETPGADGVPVTRRFLKTDCPACVDAALDPFKTALAQARQEIDRLRDGL